MTATAVPTDMPKKACQRPPEAERIIMIAVISALTVRMIGE